MCCIQRTIVLSNTKSAMRTLLRGARLGSSCVSVLTPNVCSGTLLVLPRSVVAGRRRLAGCWACGVTLSRRRGLDRVVAGFEPERLDGGAAVGLSALFARLGKVAEAGQARPRDESTCAGLPPERPPVDRGTWSRRPAGVAIERRRDAVEVGKRLRDQPRPTGLPPRSLSLDQAGVITEAAEVAIPTPEPASWKSSSRDTAGTARAFAGRSALGRCDREERYGAPARPADIPARD